MKTISSRDVQKNYGAVADLVGSGEVVRVTKYGRPAFLIIPETQDTAELLRRMAGKRLSSLLQSSIPNPAAKALTQSEVNQLIEECFA